MIDFLQIDWFSLNWFSWSWFSLNWFSLNWQWSESWALGDCWCKYAESLLIGVIVREKIRRSRGEESTKWSLIIDPTISSPYFPFQLLVSWIIKIVALLNSEGEILGKSACNATKLPLPPFLLKRNSSDECIAEPWLVDY